MFISCDREPPIDLCVECGATLRQNEPLNELNEDVHMHFGVFPLAESRYFHICLDVDARTHCCVCVCVNACCDLRQFSDVSAGSVRQTACDLCCFDPLALLQKLQKTSKNTHHKLPTIAR